MNRTYRQWVAALAVAAGVLTAAQAFADPPARVARLNYMKGSVSFRPASLDDWAPATINYPLTTGDHLWTDASSWAELHIGSTAIRLAPTTAFAFLNLDDRATQVRLSEGALDVRVRNFDGSDSFEIDTPSAAVVLRRPGVYRVDVLPDGGSTRVTVRYGLAGVTADGPDFWVRDGETAAIYGTDDAVSHEIFRAAAEDNWERWCRDRDAREDRAASVRYVSYEMTGYEDLDDYGSWTSVPEYGWAWRPRVAYGWAPYHYGQWRWVAPWGWSWVDDEPWGFAPFHYGRWACLRGSWYWVPGTYVVRPIYSPALVAFIGGEHWGLSFGFGRSHLGWFPLAPGEFWMPHYRASHTYIRNLNITNVNVTNINITNYDVSRGTYVNRAVAGAVTAVPRDAFLGGRAVARDAVNLDSRAAMRAQVIGTSAALAPRVDSVMGRRTDSVSRPPSSALNRAVVARSQPPAAPAPFAAQERALQANGGRPLDETAMARLRTETGSRGNGAPVRIAGARGGGMRGDAARGEQQPGVSTAAPAGGNYGAAARRGERVSPDASRPAAGQGVPGAARPEVNDRPGWARPRGGETQPTNPRYSGDDRAGVRGRPGAAAPDGGNAPADRPGAGSTGSARPRGGEPGNSNDRPAAGTSRGAGVQARPSGGENSRPNNPPPAGSRRGGDTQAAPQPSRPSGGDNSARPRGGRGGQTAAYEQSSARGIDANDRPPEARSWAGAARPSASESPRTYGGYQAEAARPRWNDRAAAPETARTSPQYRAMPESRATPQYRATPESRPTPQYRAVPESRPTPEYRSMPESRPAPQYRAMPESRPTPQYRSAPESRPMPQYRSVPESRPMPQYRSVPESRPTPQYRSVPESRPTPQYRSVPESRPSSGGAVERRGGGGSAAPAPRAQQPSGGQSAPRGGARNRGRGGE